MYEERNHDDLSLNATLNRCLSSIPGDTSTVRIEVEKGIAYLDGVVGNAELRRRIEECIRSSAGVRNVVNSIVVEHVLNLTHFGYVPIHPN